jgi:FliI/YscN family ATPase
MPLEETDGLHMGDPITARKEDARMEAGPELLGRVIDGFGKPLDDLGPIGAKEPYDLYAAPPGPLDREPIGEPLVTGIRAIDSLLTCGKGQRIGIFGGSGVGKSTLLGAMSRHSSADVSVIALIGERNREVRDFIEHELGPDGLKRSVLVVATSDRPAPLRIRAAFVALAVAEFFRDQGKSVLLVMDSVTRLAMAQREIGLAAANRPAKRGTRRRCSICSRRFSSGPAGFAKGRSPDSSRCWWRATISTNRFATRCGPSWTATSSCRGSWGPPDTTRPSTCCNR